MPRALLVLLLAATALGAAAALPARAGPHPGLRPITARSAGATRATDGDGPAVYLVVMADPPLARAEPALPGTATAGDLQRIQAQQTADIAGIAATLGRDLLPLARFAYALNGLALSLTPAEADAVARMPGVRLVQRDRPLHTLTDRGPPRIGAAQADLRPAVFFARLVAPGVMSPADLAGAPCPAALGDDAPPTDGTLPDGSLSPGDCRPAMAAPLQQATLARAEAAYDAAAGRLALRLIAAGLAETPTAARLVLATPGQPDTPVADLTSLAVPGAPAFAGELILGAAPGLGAAAVEDALLRGSLELVVATATAPAGAARGVLQPARGDGVIAGVLDSGINPLAPSFGAVDSEGRAIANPLGPGVRRGVCDPESGDYQPAFPCNERLIGAYALPGGDLSDPQGRPSPFDDNGHGSHVAATLAGSRVPTAEAAGLALGPLAGVAPHASLIAYDVCSGGSCSLVASVAAIDRAVADGVGVINFSIGAPPADPWDDAVALAMLGALEAGVLTAVAAGNAGPDPDTISVPANAPWVMAVGATSHGRRVGRLLAEFSGGGAPPPPLAAQGPGATAIPSAPIISGAALPSFRGTSNEDCQPFAAQVRLDGAIVVCRWQRFLGSMAVNVERAGGAALVVVWPPLVGRQLPLLELSVPVAHLDAAAGAALLAWLGTGTGHRASLGAAAVDQGGPDDSVAYFSSRGPVATSPDLLKPDLSAPGLNILAADADYDPARADYIFLSGTSMASPHAAGAAALLRQVHPDWSAAELRSALMTTAEPGLRLADEATPATPHDVGAGRLRVDLAARAGLLFDETAADFRVADPSAGGSPSRLNLPALSRDLCLGTCVFTRTVRNALAVPTDWVAQSEPDPGLDIVISPERLALAPGAAGSFTVSVGVKREAATPSDRYRYGAVRFEEAAGLAPDARLPVAINTRSSVLPAGVATRTTAPAGSLVTPTIRSIRSDDLTVRLHGLSRPTLQTFDLAEDPTPFDPLDGGPGVYSTTVLLEPQSVRFTAAVAGTTAPDIDLLVFADGEGGPADGVPQLDELTCLSAGARSDERCDLLFRPGPARRLIVLVQNYFGSVALSDRVRLQVNAVPAVSLGNMAGTGPAAVAADSPYSVRLDWSLPDLPEAAGLYQGVVELSSSGDPARAGDLGYIPVDLIYARGLVYLPEAWR